MCLERVGEYSLYRIGWPAYYFSGQMFGKFDMFGRIVSSVMGVSIMHSENKAKLFVLLRFKIYKKLRLGRLLNTSLEFKYMYFFGWAENT